MNRMYERRDFGVERSYLIYERRDGALVAHLG